MVKKPNKERYIATKNYIYAALFIIAVILICWYIFSWWNVKNKEKYINSYLLSTNTVTLEIKNLKEAPTVLKDAPSTYFVYVGYTNDKEEYELEEDLKNIIDKYRINSEVYYIDVTEEKENSDIIEELNRTFSTDKISNIPCILYYEATELEDVIVNRNGLFKVSDFEDLLKEQGYTKEAK